MNRRDLVAAIAEATGEDKKLVDSMLKATTDVFTATVGGGDPVVISGFAKFAKIDRAAYAKTAVVVTTVMIVMFPAFTSAAASARRTFAGMTRTTESAARKNEPRRDKRENDETRFHLANEVNGNTIAWPPGITICNRLSAVNASFGQSTLV